TTEGVVKGKVPYLAPEQLKTIPLDRRCDVYALGITLWECTTMRRLFKRETDIATLMAIRDAKVPDARELVKDYPDELWAIVKCALEPDRDQRFADAAEMGRALDSFVNKDDTDMIAALERLMSELFSGERPRQQAWLAETLEMPPSRKTMAPPAP